MKGVWSEDMSFGAFLKRIEPVLLFSFVLSFFVYLLFQDPFGKFWVDFPVYFEAGQKAMEHQTVYDVQGKMQFKYAPFIALLFGGAFSHFSFETASFVYQKLLIFSFFALLFLSIRFYFPSIDRNRFLRVLSLTILIFGNAFIFEQELGQVNVYTLALLTGVFWILGRPKGRGLGWAGFLLSLAVQIKLYSLIVLPYLIFKREFRVLIAFSISMLTLNLIGLALAHGLDFAVSENLAWLSSLTQSTSDLLAIRPNISLLGELNFWFPGSFLNRSIWGGAVAVFLFFQWANRDKDVYFQMAFQFPFILILTPLAWSYWVLLLIPSFLFLLKERSLMKSGVLLKGAFILTGFLFAAQHAVISRDGGIFIGVLLFVFAVLKTRSNFYLPNRT